MDVVNSYLPAYACLASLIAIPGILLFRGEPFLREAMTFAAGAVKLGLVIAIYQVVKDGTVMECRFVDGLAGVSLPIFFRVDQLSILFALVASSLWIVTSLYAIGYMRGLEEGNQARFFAFFALSLSATLGVAFAGNLLTLYLCYELLSLSTWPLVTHHQDREARNGGRTYLSYLLGTSIGFALPALIYTYHLADGDLSFAGTAILGATEMGHLQAVVLLMAFAFGFSKAGLMPFHSWLPGAMVAPTPVSALLHAVAVVKVGVFCVIRVVTGVFGVDLLRDTGANDALLWVSGFTMIVASMIALSQDNLKRRLAFSTIGQLSYILFGIALLDENGMLGAIVHLVAHASGKITLFFCAGAIYVASGKKNISQLGGIGRTMPLTMTAFFVGSLSVIGLPPTIGLISKFHLVLGAAGVNPWLMLVYLVSTFLNACYFLPIVIRAFYPGREATNEEGGARFSWGKVEEAPWTCVIPLCLTALISIALFFFPGPLIDLAKQFLGAG